MKNNTKLKHKNYSQMDWSHVPSIRRKMLEPQRKKRNSALTKLLAKLGIKFLVFSVIAFIFSQVFLSVKDFNISLSLPFDELSELIHDLSPISESSISQIQEAYIEPEKYSAISSNTLMQNATIKATIKSGDSIDQIIERYGFSSQDSKAIEKAWSEFQSKSLHPYSLKAGLSLEVQMNSEGLAQNIKVPLDEKSSLFISRTQVGTFEASLSSQETKTGERILFGGIESSFAASAVKSGLSYDLVDDLVDIFSDRVSFHKDFKKGDRFTVIYQEHEVMDGAKSNSGVILAAALEISGKHLVAVRFVGADGKARYFNEKGQVLGDSFLRFPLKFSKISSYFTTARFHPVLKIKRPHNGVDFAAPVGTPVRTVGDGIVQFAGRKGGYGIIVEIKHSDRYVTGYAHLSSIASGLSRGDRVQRGQLIGAVGMTGLSTGPHLHFSLFDRGQYVDPLRSDLPRTEMAIIGKDLSERYFKRALFTLEHYQSVAANSVQSNFMQ